MVATTAAHPHRRLFGRRTAGAMTYMPTVGHVGLGSVGLLLVLASAWGGIVPFVGPIFGYSADGAGSWHWSLAHAVMAVVPGAIALMIGLTVLASSRGIRVGRGRFSLATAGLFVMACGAWFALAPWAWPVVDNSAGFFHPASPLHQLANVAGYAVGPGAIVAVCGAFFMGWAARHQEVGPVVTNPTFGSASTAEAERRG